MTHFIRFDAFRFGHSKGSSAAQMNHWLSNDKPVKHSLNTVLKALRPLVLLLILLLLLVSRLVASSRVSYHECKHKHLSYLGCDWANSSTVAFDSVTIGPTICFLFNKIYEPALQTCSTCTARAKSRLKINKRMQVQLEFRRGCFHVFPTIRCSSSLQLC